MDLNSEQNRNELIADFPLLLNDPMFAITSEQTTVYNCIAWAMGFKDRWAAIVDGRAIPKSGVPNGQFRRFIWWPDGVEQSMRPEALVAAFKAVGFAECKSGEIETGYDKVALYLLNGEWTHASRIIGPNEEHSKFGESWDARHGAGMVSGTCYGQIYCYMRREYSRRQEYIDKYPIMIAGITINESSLSPVLSLLRAKLRP